MLVRVNGEDLDLPDGATVRALLEKVRVDPARVAVERNCDVVPRRTWDDCRLTEGDQIEIVTFVGGG